MDDMKDEFEQAVAASKNLPTRPDNMTMLRLYALYKQGTEGDCTQERPGAMDFVGRAKHDAWAALAGTPQEEARLQYVTLVGELGQADA